MRDRLIELILQTYTFTNQYKLPARKQAKYLADYLLNNGVIVPPCKVGDTVYTIHRANYRHNGKPYVDELCVTEINHKCDRNGKDIGWGVVLYSIENHTTTRYKMSNVGKTVFLSREEAEAALKGGTE